MPKNTERVSSRGRRDLGQQSSGRLLLVTALHEEAETMFQKPVYSTAARGQRKRIVTLNLPSVLALKEITQTTM